MGGRFTREETYVYLWLIHVDIWQKPTKYYKAIILQLKINICKKQKKKKILDINRVRKGDISSCIRFHPILDSNARIMELFHENSLDATDM